MVKFLVKTAKVAAVLAACLSMAACDDVRVYGSVGYSTYSGYGGYGGYGSGYGTSVTVGGRIY